MIQIYDKASFASLRAAQYAAFHKEEPGSWFRLATARIAAQSPQVPVLALGLEGGEAVVFDGTGDAVIKYKQRTTRDKETGEESTIAIADGVMKQGHRGWLLDISAGPAGCSPCVAKLGDHRYAAGLLLVTGKGNTGKTPLIHALGAELGGSDGYAVVRFGEPMSGYNTDFDLFITEVAECLTTHRVIVIDSLKDVIGAAGGNATSGGISRGAFHLMSDLGALAATRGCVVIAALNPTSSDDKIVDLVNEAARSNSTSLAIPTTVSGQWEILTRTGEGLERLTHKINTSYGDNSVLAIDGGESDRGVRVSKTPQVKISQDDYEAALRRLTN